MLLTILGCSGSAPGPGAAASGYLIEAAGASIVVDLGNGTLAALQGHRDPFTLDALLLSHLHPDHCADVSALTVLRRYHPRPPYDTRARRLPVHAPQEAADRLGAAYAPSAAERAETDLSDVLDFQPLRPGPRRIGPFEVTVFPVTHPCEAYGFRIRYEDRVLAYTGDTGPCPELDELAAGADLLLAEATWPDHPNPTPDLHLSGKQAGELAKSAGAQRLLVTHVASWFDVDEVVGEAAEAFAGPTLRAVAGHRHEV
ncbi:MBL fold metallo-hydrolase [Actinoalloteichus hymeniacidonis]|uniref:Metal-dependent hydrolase, beta-lactamase superfamily III n=1 Tax=Actinoalloteichus hymeniacidonis TaxID=340345 RepID=A0AAC9MXB9_9PSEU|nr:MBL fold metallo-hydrolase [Actinoalloteichus hymeniacidonis]AOS62129.1 metal-dependent hydrolase, beta-lactamase superfamily III [Actinoalloteichus hymeniacidonis]MBB5909849.1 ribonuclease BN (tRNA processing enzyme) [Actinoalloteichus hymeniacidonis]